MELLGSVAAHRHARRPYGVIARARRDAPLQGVPPTAAPREARPCASISPVSHRQFLSCSAKSCWCMELPLPHGSSSSSTDWLHANVKHICTTRIFLKCSMPADFRPEL